MTELLVLVIMFGLIVVVGGLTWLITEIVGRISLKRHNKWCACVFEKHPELKVLLSEYSRLRKEHCQTVKDALELQKSIDEWTEKNRYLPHGHRVDGHIELLKESYQELLEIKAEQWELVEEAKKTLDSFWENNFPDLQKEKRIMWWSE